MGIVEEAHNVDILGSGERKIVLGHGFGCDQSAWRHLVRHLLDEQNQVFLYDNIGAGTTNPDYFDFGHYSSLEGYAYDLLGILEELQIQSCIFVGHSISAMIGLLAFIIRPDLFSKLVMLGSSPSLFNYKSWCLGFAPLIVGRDMGSVAVQEFSRTLFNVRSDIAVTVVQTTFESDVRQKLGLVTVPCHIIQSMKDMVVPVVVSEFMHQNLGGKCIVEVIQTEGHHPQLSAPEIVIPIILRHMMYDISA